MQRKTCWCWQILLNIQGVQQNSILAISHSIFHQIIKNWTFLKSTRNGLLKNVQYGISRPLGSREIQKTKVAAVLWDTLYKFKRNKKSESFKQFDIKSKIPCVYQSILLLWHYESGVKLIEQEQPTCLAARNYSRLQKLFGISPVVCQTFILNFLKYPIF